MPFDWQSATDAEVDLQYSPSQFSKRPLDEYLHEYNRLSAPWAGKNLVIPGAPLLVYIHGGYWQRLSAADSLFNADDAQQLGFSLHATDYTLAPHATVEQIVQECIDDVSSVLDRAQAPRVVVAGCSAGAHLATMVAMSPRLTGRVGMVVLLSGIYDLRPVVRINDNDALGLDTERAAALSPALLPHAGYPPNAVVAVGRHEPGEFIRQSAEYAVQLRDNGVRTAHAVIDNRDHFDLPYDLLRTGTFVGDHVVTYLQTGEWAG
jgi:arylformamidase